MAEYVYYQQGYFFRDVNETYGAILGISLGFTSLLNKQRDENNRVSVGSSHFPVINPETGNMNESFEALVEKYGVELNLFVPKNKLVSVLLFQIPERKDMDIMGRIFTSRKAADVELTSSELDTLDTLMSGMQYVRFK